MNIDQIMQAAVILEIELTNANAGTEIYQCWDRVEQAWYYYQDNMTARLNIAIREANSYAI
jgi:hypothetical protein